MSHTWAASRVASYLVVATTVLLAHIAPAAAEFAVPALTGPVVDQAGILDASTQQKVENAIRALKEKGGSQITVLTVSSLEGMPIEQASIKVVEAWKLGGEKTDTGVLLMVAPKDRRMRIEVGQGLEGVLTDIDSKRIIADYISPLFRAGDYAGGIIVGVYQIAKKTDPTIDLTQYLNDAGRPSYSGKSHASSPLRFWITLICIIFFLVFGGLGGGGGFRRRISPYGGGFGGPGFGGGGWGGSGGGGGGWGGGGGGFSGGGASGDW